MGQKINAGIIVFIVLILISLALSGAGFYLFQKERLKALDLEQKLNEVTLKQKETESKLKDSQKSVSELQSKLDQSKSQIDALDTELQQEKDGRADDQEKLKQTKQELQQQKSIRQDLEMKISLAQDDSKKAVERLKELDTKKKELESKVKELESKVKDLESRNQGIELGRIVVGPETTESAPIPTTPTTTEQKKEIIQPETASAPTPEKPLPDQKKKEKSVKASSGLEGRVLVLNRDYNFVVISLGSKDGVNLADTFSIYHDNNYVGDIKVEKVHDSMSAAGFESAGIKDKVSEGDKVVQKIK
jgi:hypothetical protein